MGSSDLQGHAHLSIAEHPQVTLSGRQDLGLYQGLETDLETGREFAQLLEVDDRIGPLVDEREAFELGNPSIERNLATFKTGAYTTTGTGILTTVATAGGLTLTGGVATANAALAVARAFLRNGIFQA